MKQRFILGALAVSIGFMGLTTISHQFEWPPLVGVACFCMAVVAAFSACWWMMFHSVTLGSAEVAAKIAEAYATADSEMHDFALETAKRHLRGEFDETDPSRKILDAVLAPAEMRAAFQATHGAQFDDPHMANARAQWVATWATARLNRGTTADPGF